MSTPTKASKCQECEMVGLAQPSMNEGPSRPCLSCSVSEDLKESHCEILSLPWSESFQDNANDGRPDCPMRQKSIQKIIHQVDMCKRMKLKRLVDKRGACHVIHKKKLSYTINFINDLFTTLIDLQWRMMLLFFSLAYVSGWAGFSGLWYCLAWWHQDLGYLDHDDGDYKPCVANMDSYVGAFLFSVETQTTIGYGFRSVTEECWLGPSLVVIQSIFSALVDAILVGCVFVKLARPKKRGATIKFSHNAVIAKRDGKLCFMFCIGDIRNSHLFGAVIRAKLVRPRITKEQECIPLHSYPMDMGSTMGEDNLLLVWPLIICHVIDEKSPMYKYSQYDMLENSFEIVVYLEGIVEQTGLLTQVRTSYLPTEIKWGHRFSSRIVSMADTDDKLHIDWSYFNVTYPVVSTPRCSAYELDFLKKTGSPLRPTNANRRRKKNRSDSDNTGGGDEARLQDRGQLLDDQGEENFAYREDEPPDYNGTVTHPDETQSPLTTPTIMGVNRFEFVESKI